jgi:hypothetical protein
MLGLMGSICISLETMNNVCKDPVEVRNFQDNELHHMTVPRRAVFWTTGFSVALVISGVVQAAHRYQP